VTLHNTQALSCAALLFVTDVERRELDQVTEQCCSRWKTTAAATA